MTRRSKDEAANVSSCRNRSDKRESELPTLYFSSNLADEAYLAHTTHFLSNTVLVVSGSTRRSRLVTEKLKTVDCPLKMTNESPKSQGVA